MICVILLKITGADGTIPDQKNVESRNAEMLQILKK